MQSVIAGTAGHVDHGKACLIKAFTGTDTSRLKEEQRRGITVEPGFANLPSDAGIHIRTIDVPGHEKFVKNILADIGGINLVLLVVVLDEGVMLQTVEHFEILKMSHIEQGIVVLTKADLVDEEWAGLVNDDVDNLVRGTLMENADRIQVFAYTGKNTDVSKQMIVDRVRAAGTRCQERELFCLPINRILTMEGFGTVVMGTLLEGCCQVGQEVELYPIKRVVKIREIQIHGHRMDMAYVSQRTALNLVNIKKDEINKGEVLAAQDSLLKSQFIDAKVQLSSSMDRELRNGDRIHINYGSVQVVCKAVPLDRDVLSAGEEAHVQFRFDESVAVRRNDRLIIRFYSPTITFGGGIALEVEALKYKRNHEDVIDSPRIEELGADLEIPELEPKEESRHFPVPKILAAKLNWINQETGDQLEALVKGKKAVRLSDGSYIHKYYQNEITQYDTELLNQFYKENPISDGMEEKEFKSRILDNFRVQESKKAGILLNEMIRHGITVTISSTIATAGSNAEYSYEIKEMLEEIEDTYLMAGYEISATDDMINKFKDKKLVKQIVNDLVEKGALVKINPGAMIHRDNREKAMGLFKKYFEDHPTISLGGYRDLLGTSRKCAILFLKYCDQQKIARKQDDMRILAQKPRQTDMEFRQLEALVNAVKYKSFSEAADVSFLTQPTISAHINSLENELGTTLMNRTGREITLTKQGELFYPYTIGMLHTRSQALAAVQAQCEAMDGVLDAYASNIPGQYHLSRLTGEFHAKCPKIRFYVEQSGSKTVIEDIMNRKGEIGLIDYKMYNSLAYEPVLMDELVLIVPDTEKYSRWKKGSTASFWDLEHEASISREEGLGARQEMEKAEIHGVPVFKNANVTARISSIEAIKQAVVEGLGISTSPRMVAGEKKESRQIKYLKIDGLEKKRTFYMVHSKNIRPSPIAEAFRDLVIDYRDRNWQQDIGRFTQVFMQACPA